jgi:AraC-like DNA-binding protein
VLHGTGLNVERLRLPATRISLTQFVTACRNGQKLSDSPGLALELGARFHVTTFGMYGYALLSHPNVRGIVEFALKYHRLSFPTISAAFREESDFAVWSIEPLVSDGLDSPLYRFFVEHELAVSITLFRDIVDTAFIPNEIRLRYVDSGQRALYEAFFGCPVIFECSANEIVLSSRWLYVSPRHGNEFNFEAVRKICDELQEQMDMAVGLSGKLRRFIIANMGDIPSIDATCRHFSVSPRTLRRKLIAENTSFKSILDETRGHLARKYLHETLLSIDEIANRLGYNEPANFRHAFRRWTGTSPNEFRQNRSDVPSSISM